MCIAWSSKWAAIIVHIGDKLTGRPSSFCCQAKSSKGRAASTTHHWLVSKISAISLEKTAAPAFIWSHRNSFFKATSLYRNWQRWLSWVVICMIVNTSIKPGCRTKKWKQIFVLWPRLALTKLRAGCSPTQYEPSLTQVGNCPLGPDPGGWYIPPLPHPCPPRHPKKDSWLSKIQQFCNKLGEFCSVKLHWVAYVWWECCAHFWLQTNTHVCTASL